MQSRGLHRYVWSLSRVYRKGTVLSAITVTRPVTEQNSEVLFQETELRWHRNPRKNTTQINSGAEKYPKLSS